MRSTRATVRWMLAGLFGLLAAPALPDNIDDGKAWLVGQQQADGSWGAGAASPATAFQASAEVLETLRFLQPQPGYGKGLLWMQGQVPADVDSLSRQLITLAGTGVGLSAIQGAVAAAQNSDGGWGLDADSASDLLDTALALRGLATSGSGNLAALQNGLGYLLGNTNPDGGVGLLAGEASQPYYTALHLLALKAYQGATGSKATNLQNGIAAACAWLAGARHPDGGWGDGGSTVFETGLAAFALANAACVFDKAPTAAYLNGLQGAAGDWNGNAYETALALRALLLIDRPNLSFGPAGIGFVPALPIEGETVDFSVTVGNAGTTDTPGVVVRLYDGDPNSGGAVIGERMLDIPAGGNVVAQFNVAFPSAGTREIYAVVDPDNQIPEASESDNSILTNLLVVIEAPDLVLRAGDVTFTPAAPVQNQLFTANAQVRNEGRLAASNVVVRFFDGDPDLGGVPIGQDQTIPSIAAGGMAVASVSYNVLANGARSIFVRVDPDNTIAESIEANNQASGTVTITPIPDLLVENADIVFSPAAPFEGQTVAISVTVRNVGGLAASAFKVRAYDGNPDAGGVPLVEWTVTGLPAGGAPLHLTYQSWLPTRTGDIVVHVVVDVAGEVTEIFEANNRAAATVSVSPVPDVSVATSDVTVNPAFPAPGVPFDIAVRVRNLGAAAATGVVVRLFDGDPDAGGTRIGTDQIIPNLPANGTAVISVAYQRAVEGQFRLYVQSDPDNAITEISEANNNVVRTVLVSEDVTLQPADPYVATITEDGLLHVAGSNGDGTFSALELVGDISSNSSSRGVVVTDLNGDGDFDIVIGYADSNAAYLYYYERNGATFEPPIYLGAVGNSTTSVSGYLMDMAAEDFNNDGAMDFVLGGNSAHTWRFLSNGPLVTEPENFFASNFETGAEGWGDATTNTGFALDSSTASRGAQSMRVFATGASSALSIDMNPADWFLSRGSTLRFDYRIPVGVPVGLLFNVSGRGWVFLGGSPAARPGTYPVSPLAASLIADGNWHSVEIDVYRAIRAVWKDASQVTEFQWWTNSNATAGDEFWFDDLRITRPRLVSGFDVALLPGTGGSGRGMDAADIDGDGNMDFARARASDGFVYRYTGDGRGGFTPSAAAVADAGSDPYGVLLGDFDNDGRVDLIGNAGSGGDPSLFRGNGDGTFQAGVLIGSLDFNNHLSLAKYDFDNDGNLDVVVATYTSRQLWVYPGFGNGAFGPPKLIGSTSGNLLAVAAPAGRVAGQPFAVAHVDATTVEENAMVGFDASGSFDDGTIVSFDWNFGDGATASGPIVSHHYSTEGRYAAILTVTDDEGLKDRVAVWLTVNGEPPTAVPGAYGRNEHDGIRGRWSVKLDGTASTDSDTRIVGYRWDFDASDGIGIDATGPTPMAVYTAPGNYTVTLTVTDEVGLTHTATGTVTIAAGAMPTASLNGPAILGEADASRGTWTGWYGAEASSDAEGIASYLIEWGDGQTSTLAPLADDFGDGNYTANPPWTVSGGTWAVSEGVLAQTDTGSAWRYLQDLDRNYRDFELTVDFMAVDTGTNDGYVGIAFRRANTSGGTNSLLLYARNSWEYWSFHDWRAGAELQRGGAGWDEGLWYRLRLRVVGDNMELYVRPEGGVETLQVQATRAGFPIGGIALLANAQSVRYDNVKVTPLDAEWAVSGQRPADFAHGFSALNTYEVKLTVTDHAGQSHAQTLTTQTNRGAAPAADAGGPYVLTEWDAYEGRWDLVLRAAATDDTNVERYVLDFGDGNSYTTGVANGTRTGYFAVGTDLYGYDTAGANLQRIVATENDTRIEVINLATRAVIASQTLQRLQSWNNVSPGDGTFFKVKATKPVVAYFTDLANHAAFAPSLDGSPVGREFVLHYDENEGFFVYGVEDAQVTFFNTSNTAVRSFPVRAGGYARVTGLAEAVYRVTATGRVAMQTVGSNGYTTVPSASGDGVGRRFLFATRQGTTGAYALFAHADAEVESFDLDTGARVFSHTLAAGELWFQNGVGTRRLRLESTGEIEVWAGDTEGGTGVVNLGDDLSFAGGRQGTEFILHELTDGIVIFAPNDGTQVVIDAGESDATTLNLGRDEYRQLAPAALPAARDVHRVVATKPIVIQTLGRASGFNDLGTWLAGVTARHRYAAPGTYTLTATAIDNVGQTRTATTQVSVTQGDPPVPRIAAPTVVDEGFASGGGWAVTFDASGSSDDSEIIRYLWNFGDGATASGVAPSHVYQAPGDYTVTLQVTDRAGQTSTTTLDVKVQANTPPTAVSGGPYVFGEEAASFGLWTAALDGSGSSDDFAIFDYLWRVPLIEDDFAGSTLDPLNWTASSGVTQDDAVTIVGAGSWGSRYLRSVGSYERPLELRARVTTSTGSQTAMCGFKNTTTGTSHTAMPYALYFNGGTLQVYEDGSSRGSFGSYDRGVPYDIRILVAPDAGATYEIKRADADRWNLVYQSSHSTASPLHAHCVVNGGSLTIDDLQLASAYPGSTQSLTFQSPGTTPINLRVRDNALQEDVDPTTITIETGAPPKADAGGPYVVEVGTLALFNGTRSTDDVNIEQYHWVFGETTGGPADLPYEGKGATATHFYRAVGTYDLSLTVTDNVLQSDTDTTTVEVIVGSPPVANIALRGAAAAAGPPAYFDASASADDYGIVEYRWDFDSEVDRDGDGDPTNDIDAVGARPFHVYPVSTENLLDERFDGGVLDTGAWLTAGATQNDSVTITGAGSWDTRYMYSTAAYPRGISFRALVTPVNTSGSQTAMVGLKDTGTGLSYTTMPHAIYFNSGTLQVYEQGSNRGSFGTYTPGQNYEVRIDVKTGAGATYYIRPAGAAQWTRLYDSTTRTDAPLRVGLVVNAGTFQVDDLRIGGEPYVVTLTVEDGAGQTDSATLAVPVAANLPPNVITVPWVAHDPIIPHETFNGRSIRLKGIVRDADPVSFQWDFGDGTSSPVTSVTNPSDLSVAHTYPDAPAGTPFTAVLKVWDRAGQMGQDNYNVIVRPQTLNTEVNIAIDEGLWYLHQQQTRTTAEGYETGYWTSDARASATASSIQAFQINGHLEGSDHSEDPYAETVTRGLRQLFRDLGTVAIGTQTFGEPDTNGNGIGIETGVSGSGGQPIYQGGQVMDAIASSGTPLARTITGATGIKRRSYFDILTDMSDQFAWGQSDGTSGGGWRYSWNADIDNSAAQWGAIGLLAAQDFFGIPVPHWVKERNRVWLNTAYNGTGWGYTTGGTTPAGTPSGLVQWIFSEGTTRDQQWLTAEKWIADNWTSQYIVNPGNRPYYPYFALAKAMRLSEPKAVVQFRTSGLDWFNDPTLGLARTLVSDQLSNGQFPGTQYITGQLRSAWGVIILSQTLFVQPPVANAGRDRAWAVDQPLTFDASGSFHLDPFRTIVRYEWDFDGDGAFDASTTSPFIDYVYTSADYPVSTLPRTFTVTLRVTDDQTPALTDTDTVNIVIAEPPHPPVAEAGGPYTCTVGLPCQLDGSGSFDIDPFDKVVRWEWELDSRFPFDFDEATGERPSVVFESPGVFDVGLRVWDNGQFNDLNGNGEVDEEERLSDQHFVKVTVRANLAPVADAGGPYSVDEGTSVGLDASGSSDPNGDPLTFAWDFNADGDFDDATGATPSFQGIDDGVVPITVRVTDGLLSHDATATMSVRNVAPVVNLGADRSIEEGATLSVIGNFSDPGADSWTATVDYGTGAGPEPLALNPDKTFQLSHGYGSNGIYTVSVSVTDDDGGTGTQTLTVFVLDRGPTAALEGDTVLNEGGTGGYDARGSTSHPDAIVLYEWDWGYDGSFAPAGDTGPTQTRTWPESGAYDIAVRVTDADGSRAIATLRVNVANLPPLVDAGSDLFARPGETVTLTSATFADPGLLDTHTATIDWGDASPVVAGAVTGADGSGSVSGSHAYSIPGEYTVTVRVTDDEGASGVDTLLVVVTPGNLPPRAVPGGPYDVPEGGTLVLDGSNSNDPDDGPGALDFAWDLDGDGDFDDAFEAVVSVPAVDDASYAVSLRVSDGDLLHSATTTVVVRNAAPVVAAGPNRTVQVGDGVALSPASFTDSGAQDTHTATIDWGDGTVAPATVEQRPGGGTVGGSHSYSAAGVYTVTVTVTDDDGGMGADSFEVTVTAPPTPVIQTIFDLRAAIKSNQVGLTWSPVAGAEQYRVYRAVAGGNLVLLASSAQCTNVPCVYLDQTVSNGVSYFYVVTSAALGVESLHSNGVHATPVAPRRGR